MPKCLSWLLALALPMLFANNGDAIPLDLQNLPVIFDFEDAVSLLEANVSDEDVRKIMMANYHLERLEPEAYMNTMEIIRYYGYPAEQHDVTTEDGYILEVQRIPSGKGETVSRGFKPGATGPRKPVILQHGLLASSAVWVINTREISLAFILADAGYDVWLTNIRGNTYGRRHVKLSPSDQAFWEFSFDEMGKYDMPAMIDFILNTTGFSQLHYIGHSMGTTMAFAMLSTRTEYNQKIKGFFALAPVTTVNHIRSPLRLLAPFTKDIEFFLDLFGKYEFLPTSIWSKFWGSTVCTSPIKPLCENILFLLCGYDLAQLNETRLPIYLQFLPAGTSTQNIAHYAQMVQSGKFQFQDFGKSKNIAKYGQPTAPIYNVSRITAPVAIFWSDNDYLADPTDVSQLTRNLPSLALKYRVPLAKFSHLDFMWAMDVKTLLYDKLLDVMRKLWRD